MSFITDLVLAIEKDKDRHVNCPFSHNQAVADEKGAAFPLVHKTGTYGDVRLCTQYGSSEQKLVNLMWKTGGPCPSDHVQVPYYGSGTPPDNIVGKEGRVCAKWIKEGDPGYDAADAIACIKKVPDKAGCDTEWTPCTSTTWDKIDWDKGHQDFCLARASGVTAMNTGEVLATAPRGAGEDEDDEEDTTNLLILAIVAVAMCVLVCIACVFVVSMTV